MAGRWRSVKQGPPMDAARIVPPLTRDKKRKPEIRRENSRENRPASLAGRRPPDSVALERKTRQKGRRGRRRWKKTQEASHYGVCAVSSGSTCDSLAQQVPVSRAPTKSNLRDDVRYSVPDERSRHLLPRVCSPPQPNPPLNDAAQAAGARLAAHARFAPRSSVSHCAIQEEADGLSRSTGARVWMLADLGLAVSGFGCTLHSRTFRAMAGRAHTAATATTQRRCAVLSVSVTPRLQANHRARQPGAGAGRPAGSHARFFRPMIDWGSKADSHYG